MSIVRKIRSKLGASLYVFKKAEIMRNIVNKEINGEYDNLCHSCYFSDRYQERARREGMPDLYDGLLRLSVYLGGALGDYIVYLRFVDQISSVCPCAVDLFLDRIEFAQFVFGDRENVTIVHDAENCLFNNSVTRYDLALHVDHGVTLRHADLGAIREKAPDFYQTACRIVEYTKANQINIAKQNERESVILRRAKFLGESKWSKLSCGGAADMAGMYSNIVLDPAAYPVLDRYGIKGRKYITVNFGADKNMGGTAQTKVLPCDTLEKFIGLFKAAHPDYLVVQTGVKNSLPLEGADCFAFECRLPETAVVLKYSTLHVDSEGGLVHLSAQMSTPSVVSFGPTPVYYYGYPRNENIVSPACSECMSVTPTWSKVCPKGLQVPECMRAITAEMIMERAEKVLARREQAEKAAKQVTKAGSVASALPGLSGLKAARVCLIGKPDEELVKAARELKDRGHTVSVYIPPAAAGEERFLLRKQGIRVEYGSALNIAMADASFDAVLARTAGIPEELTRAAERELSRLTVPDGMIVLCGGEEKAGE